MTYKPFSIVTVSFPFTDKANVKRRPALVLSSQQHQEHTRHITLLMITSAQNSSWPSDYLIDILEGTGLNSASIVRQKIFTIDIEFILKCIGELAPADTQEVIKRLKVHVGGAFGV